MPPLPELPDNARKEGVWSAYWSPRVEQLTEEWQVTVRKLQHAGMIMGMARAANGATERWQPPQAALRGSRLVTSSGLLRPHDHMLNP